MVFAVLLLAGALSVCIGSGVAIAQSAPVERPAATHPYAVHIAEASQRFGIPEHWIRAVLRAESAGDVRAVSSAGAMGLMQVMPDTWAGLRVRHGLGRDPYNPRDNILAGTAYLREMFDRYGNVAAMLAAYNAGPGRYDEHRATGRPLPAETRAYWVKFVITRVRASPEKAARSRLLAHASRAFGRTAGRLRQCPSGRPRQTRRTDGPSAPPPDREALRLRGCGHVAGRLLAGGGRGIEGTRCPMTTLKVGIADYEEMKARTMRITRGEEKPAPSDPKVWFTSTESFAKVLSAGNRELLRIIAEKAPASLEELAEITGRAGSNLSRTLKTMESYGLVRLEPGHGRKLAPKVVHDRVELALPLIDRPKAKKAMGGRP